MVPISEAIIEQLSKCGDYDYELLFIDNDSRDTTRDKICLLCAQNPKIKAIFNAKNYGQFNSPYYGILQATGDCVISMAADFQDPPELIPQYVEAWEEGYKLVMCQKTSSKESRLVYRARRSYYRFMRKHSSVEWLEQVNGSGLYDREFVEIMRKIDDPKPFLRGVVAEMGYKIKLIPFEQPKRRAGKSSNNLFSYYDGAMQSITSYTKYPVRLAAGLGLGLTAVSAVAWAVAIINKILNWDSYAFTDDVLALAIFSAVSLNLFFIGMVGEYVMNVNDRVRKRPLVVEAERINFGRERIREDRVYRGGCARSGAQQGHLRPNGIRIRKGRR